MVGAAWADRLFRLGLVGVREEFRLINSCRTTPRA